MLASSPRVRFNGRAPMRGTIIDPHRAFAWLPTLGAGVRASLRWGSNHTGLPIILVAAVALVLSWRLFRQSMRLAAEVVLATVVLVAATRLGWIRW